MKFDQRYFNNFFSHRIDDTYFLSLYTNSTEEYVSWVGSTNSNPITIEITIASTIISQKSAKVAKPVNVELDVVYAVSAAV